MSGRRSEDREPGQAHGHGNSGTEQLLGNGTLTVAARLMSVAGVPLAALLLTIIGYFASLQLGDIRDEMKANRIERQALASMVGEFKQRFAEIDRRNDVQDAQIDRIRDRLGAVRSP